MLSSIIVQLLTLTDLENYKFSKMILFVLMIPRLNFVQTQFTPNVAFTMRTFRFNIDDSGD